jgi:carbon monoxide dehydrogenase subunit G
MSVFESKVTINKPVDTIYQFLSDFNNHQQLMADNVQDWSSTFNEASFGIQNMVKLFLKIEDRIENQEIRIIPSQKPPFELELKWTLLPNNDGTDVTFTISAELNMMMKMVASGPLQKLADQETQKLAALIN